ncbi:pyridoxal-phosphate dependent enzyme [Puia dinghuensis]|uniref:2,3-diaminopropionate biosynthesis protein SbnA n=1 Tax=Puia dinghuensis TaxID=1792502 RepID=A0A8J2XSU2_9BACT|nr:pyridoxal-phosphate dependent enzyme [Puia dinghuensis]GGA93606.1 2,3-diaminopropionate biosynthesis protein SbnA [Puia dinghuensis]
MLARDNQHLLSLESLSKHIGNTPLKNLQTEDMALFAKLEYANFSGSSKDRAAFSMLYHAIKEGKVNDGTTIIASSSGNLAISLALICKHLHIKFIPVIDPNINKAYETLLDLVAYRVDKVDKRDTTGGYLLTRIERANELCHRIGNSFCADQYSDINNYKGYYSLGNEIIASSVQPDYIFVAVSSGGTITGISRSVKQRLPKVQIVGVDIEGSVIFGTPPATRFISGIGSSKVPPILKDAVIDDVIHVSHFDIIKGCHDLLNEQMLFAGASSGAVYLAAKRYLSKDTLTHKPKAMLIFPDRGSAYIDTIYNKEWMTTLKTKFVSCSA